MARCSKCRRGRGTHESITGRPLCRRCYDALVTVAGVGSGAASGRGMRGARRQGRTSRGWSGAVLAEAEAARARREKLDATEGFWRRLWVRVVG